jgi:hypothetical protein
VAVRIVEGGRRRPVLSAADHAPGGNRWRRKQEKIRVLGGKALTFAAYGASVQRVHENVETIRAALGCNRADAVRIALHATARAVREGRLP